MTSALVTNGTEVKYEYGGYTAAKDILFSVANELHNLHKNGLAYYGLNFQDVRKEGDEYKLRELKRYKSNPTPKDFYDDDIGFLQSGRNAYSNYSSINKVYDRLIKLYNFKFLEESEQNPGTYTYMSTPSSLIDTLNSIEF